MHRVEQQEQQNKKTPAQKAWETMRERYSEEEVSERAREAAYKAWETRRKKQGAGHASVLTSADFKEMHLYTRHKHGSCPVRVFRDEEGETVYELTTPSEMEPSGSRVERFGSARGLMRAIYGHDVHMPFDRYFRLGKYRSKKKGPNLLSLLEHGVRRTEVVVHDRVKVSIDPPRETSIVLSPTPRKKKLPEKTSSRVETEIGAVSATLADPVEEFVEAMSGISQEDVVATPEMKAAFDKEFVLALDRLEGLVGIDLGAVSERKGTVFKADEVRKLLWRGFAGKMLSQGYDPDDVLQEVYRGLLVRNEGKCPWDGRKSTFGHYVHMVISCVLTNYHRKQVRRPDRDAVPMETRRDGEELGDVGQWGACEIEHGSEVGEKLALEGLDRYLDEVPCEEPEAVLGRRILPLVAAGLQRGEIVERTGNKPSMVSRALAWLRRQTAAWALSGGHAGVVPAKYRT